MIDDALPALRSAFARGTRAVLQAPPGAGKTTRVPLALFGEPWAAGGKIVMLEPRRLAARAAARWMAATLGEEVGATVGYRVRGDSRVGRRTRVEVVTEGVLTRLIQDDPALEGIAMVIFDEFHERNLVADLGLALTLQTAELLRPDLRLLVMSATLDGAAVAALLGGAPVVTSEGRSHAVETRWVPHRAEVRIEGAVASVVERALAAHAGDLLVFLPGAAEIRRVETLLGARALGAGTRVYALHGSMPLDEQDRAIAPSAPGARKVVLATSVAETSLTIEGVRVVIDSGLARVPRFTVRSGMTRLETVRVSRDAAEQRRGRAGRVAPGTCYRLWDQAEHAQLLERRTPEMLEADLAPLALELAAAGIGDPRTLRWLDLPPAGALAQARDLLEQLGALDADGRLTSHGAAMAGIGIHPRLAHLLVRGAAMGHGALACDVAALLAERDVLRRDAAVADPDLRTRVELLRAAGGAQDARHDARDDARVDRGRLFQVRDEARRLRGERGIRDAPSDLHAVGALVALAYPDRLGMRRAAERGRFILRNGRGARISDLTPLADADFIAVADTDGAAPEAKVYLAAPLTLAELEEIARDQIVREDAVEFDDSTRTVRAVTRERLGALVLSERAQRDPDATAVAAAIGAAVRRAGIAALPWSEGARRIRQRLAFLHRHDASWPDVADDALFQTLDAWLAPSLAQARRWTDVERLDLGALLLDRVGWERRAEFDELAPTHLVVPSGSRVPLDYSDPAAPVLAVRLQELFGAVETPRVARGQVAVTLHLLSPASRPVQVTRDLAGFWANTYFDVRKDLRGRYPRHYWPDDPLVAEPTKRVKPRTDSFHR